MSETTWERNTSGLEERGTCARTMRPQVKTDASKDLVIRAKERRIKELEAQVQTLKRDLQVALGKLYEHM